LKENFNKGRGLIFPPFPFFLYSIYITWRLTFWPWLQDNFIRSPFFSLFGLYYANKKITMRVELIKVAAKLVPVDTFVYLPEKNLFFFVDDTVVEEDEVTFISEIGVDKKGLITQELVYKPEDEVSILATYRVNKTALLKEIKEAEERLEEDEE